jgi:aspartyl/asparaginyl beta-hydroxylase (cupin superfamily)
VPPQWIVHEDMTYGLKHVRWHEGEAYWWGHVLPRDPQDYERGTHTVALVVAPDDDWWWRQPRIRFAVEKIGYEMDVPEYREEDDPRTYAGALKMFALALHDVRKSRGEA